MKGVLVIIIVFISFVAQTTAFHFTPGRSPWPDLALLLAVYGGLRWGKIRGIQFGILVGLVQDFLSFEAMGAYLCSKGAIGFIVGKLKEKYIHDTPVARSIVVLSATIFDAIIYGFLIHAFLGFKVTPMLTASILPLALINLAFSFLLFPAMGRLDALVNRLLGKTEEKYMDVKSEN